MWYVQKLDKKYLDFWWLQDGVQINLQMKHILIILSYFSIEILYAELMSPMWEHDGFTVNESLM